MQSPARSGGAATRRIPAREHRLRLLGLDEPILATTASILFSFLIYIVAERLHVSGVLAVVVYTATVLAKLYSEAIEAMDAAAPRNVAGIVADLSTVQSPADRMIGL